MTLCPDIKTCEIKEDGTHFRCYCLGKPAPNEYGGYYRCYHYEECHTVRRTPAQWMKIKKIIEAKE